MSNELYKSLLAQYEANQAKRDEAQKLMIAAKRSGKKDEAEMWQQKVRDLNVVLRPIQKRLFYAKKSHFTP